MKHVHFLLLPPHHSFVAALCLAMVLSAACDPSSDSQGAQDASETTANASESTGTDWQAVFACVETDLQVVPLFGPGWDSESQSLIGEPKATYVVHTTQALVPEEQLPHFEALSVGVAEQLMQTPGLIAIGFASEPNCGFERTMGVWESEQAMYAFVGSGAHAQAMAQTADLQAAGRVMHFEVSASELPIPWDTLITRLSEVEPFGT